MLEKSLGLGLDLGFCLNLGLSLVLVVYLGFGLILGLLPGLSPGLGLGLGVSLLFGLKNNEDDTKTYKYLSFYHRPSDACHHLDPLRRFCLHFSGNQTNFTLFRDPET